MGTPRQQARTLVMIVRDFMGSRPAPVEFDGEDAWARHSADEDCVSTSFTVVASIGEKDGEFLVEVDQHVRDCDGPVSTYSRYLVTVRRKAKRHYYNGDKLRGSRGTVIPQRLNCTRVQEWVRDAYAEAANY